MFKINHDRNLDKKVIKVCFENTINDGGSTETHSKAISGWTGLDPTKKVTPPRAINYRWIKHCGVIRSHPYIT